MARLLKHFDGFDLAIPALGGFLAGTAGTAKNIPNPSPCREAEVQFMLDCHLAAQELQAAELRSILPATKAARSAKVS